MNHILLTYSLYLVISIALTVWVAHTLFKNGRVFLVDCFHRNEPLADSINHLLVVGFYLINLGFICLFLKLGIRVDSPKEVFEALSGKMGVVLLTLGVMHFFNLLVLAKLRRRARAGTTPPPLPA
ncbi:MAG: hypothetical protein IAE97_01395 [Chthoniobacterales bacterium]|nr:hypothetical protein [Chthoniobacterales bacterium]